MGYICNRLKSLVKYHTSIVYFGVTNTSKIMSKLETKKVALGNKGVLVFISGNKKERRQPLFYLSAPANQIQIC